MIDNRIEFDERYDCEEYETTTLYFTAPKDLIHVMLGREYPDAVSMDISIECPTGQLDAQYASVGVSPTNENGEDFDWCDVDLSYDEIEELIVLAEKSNMSMTV